LAMEPDRNPFTLATLPSTSRRPTGHGSQFARPE